MTAIQLSLNKKKKQLKIMNKFISDCSLNNAPLGHFSHESYYNSSLRQLLYHFHDNFI